MTRLVDDLADKSDENSAVPFMSIHTAAVAFTAAAPPAAVATIPITVAVAFAQWVYLTYARTPGIIRCLMGYIVDLTIVMQALFWLMQDRGDAAIVLRKSIKSAYDTYAKKICRLKVHDEIRTFGETFTGFKVVSPKGKDETLAEVIRLIKTHRFNPMEKNLENDDNVGAKDEPAAAEADDDSWE